MNSLQSSRLAAESFSCTVAADGATYVRSRRELGAYGRAVCDDLRLWASRTPNRTFVAERSGAGWRELSYAAAFDRVRTLGGGLCKTGANANAPLAILAENGIEHALVSLAAHYVGIPVSPISVGYASADAAPARLRSLLATLGPALAFAIDPQVAGRLRDFVPTVTDASEFEGDPARADAAAAAVGPDTVAKIMFTSGSTGTPKGVITTHGMLCSNQAMLEAVWPELRERPPVIVDWLPWSHCFGGSHNFGMILHNGGSLYVDGGRPMPGPFELTLENVREHRPNIIFSVPRGFALFVERLRADDAYAATFFSELRIACSGGASLPDALRREFIGLAARHAAQTVRVTSSWGTTECAPLATTSWGDSEPDDDTIGTPVPGTAVKLVPSEGRYEICVRGPNITQGYWRDPVATAAAFDDEGFYHTGDAGALKDAADPSRGILYTGRLVENFKLTSGTWVNVGALRLALIERCAPIVEDLIVCGHDRDAIAVLLFLSRSHAARHADLPDADLATLARDPAVAAFVDRALEDHNAASAGSSTRVSRAVVLPEAPNRGEGEIADKGSINQRRALELRAADIISLYAEPARFDASRRP